MAIDHEVTEAHQLALRLRELFAAGGGTRFVDAISEVAAQLDVPDEVPASDTARFEAAVASAGATYGRLLGGMGSLNDTVLTGDDAAETAAWNDEAHGIINRLRVLLVRPTV